MSYQVLARKWRPATFHEMRGQEHVLQALVNGLDSDRLHHAYLFTGTRGVGKTSVARILAKCLNCETGVTSKPCGVCGACIEIAENRFVDLIEVDAASRTKVEDTRELLENVQYAPSNGRFKIYLIDEVHMLSTHSFNALLKTLEEPPPHVKFLLATTDPQRLPATILSRCLQFSLKNLAPEVIVDHLQTIMSAEGLAAEVPALWAIARAASGSMRDALSLTDQAIAYSGDAVREHDVQTMLGTIDRDSVCDVLEALAQRDAKTVLALADQVASNGTDLALYIEELLSGLHNVAVFQAVPDCEAPELASEQRLKQLASTMLAEDVQLYYQIAVQAQRDLPFAPEPRVGLEMALLRMLTFLPDDDSTELAESEEANGAERSSAAAQPSAAEEQKKKPELTTSSSSKPAMQATGLQAQPAAHSAVEPIPHSPTHQTDELLEARSEAVSGTVKGYLQEVPRREHSPRPIPVPLEAGTPRLAAVPKAATAAAVKPDIGENYTASKLTEATPPVSEAAAADVSSDASDRAGIKADNWLQVFSDLKLAGMAKNVASNCELVDASDHALSFCLDEDNCKLFQAAHVRQLEAAIEQYAGRPIKVHLEPGIVHRETPYLFAQRRKRERQAAAVDSIMADPYVSSILTTFGGQVEQETITPLAPASSEDGSPTNG